MIVLAPPFPHKDRDGPPDDHPTTSVLRAKRLTPPGRVVKNEPARKTAAFVLSFGNRSFSQGLVRARVRASRSRDTFASCVNRALVAPSANAFNTASAS